MKNIFNNSLLIIFIFIFLSSSIIPTYASEEFLPLQSEVPQVSEGTPVIEEAQLEETPVTEETPADPSVIEEEPTTVEESATEETSVDGELIQDEPVIEEEPVTEEEPDGTSKEKAILIDINEGFDGTITDAGYTWYITELDTNQTYSLHKVGGNYLSFYPDNSTEYEYRSDYSSNTSFDFTPINIGTYYLKIEGSSGASWSLKSAEAGITKQTAIPIDLSNGFEGTITETRYTWYKTELDANQTYNWYK
ncbi:hypothetical protein, partial [Chengkuizengella sediminis]|uniref:hypothetical protein n=1 Tax=Chengkuizengella sediminis TaxID=1885917 RepID=UPI001389B5A1